MIYVYAIVELPARSAPPELPRLRGLGRRPVELRTTGRLGAACTIHDSEVIPRTAENVWPHERIVESLMNDYTVLPARFGTTFRNEAALDDVLRPGAGGLAAGFDHVRGCVELGLRVLWRANHAEQGNPPADDGSIGSTPTSAATPGHAYMLARLARERRSREAHHAAEQLAAALHDDLAALARDSTRRVISEPFPQLAASFLVPCDRADTFNARVRQLAAEHPHLSLLCTGPWPPYHFVPTLTSGVEAAHA